LDVLSPDADWSASLPNEVEWLYRGREDAHGHYCGCSILVGRRSDGFHWSVAVEETEGSLIGYNCTEYDTRSIYEVAGEGPFTLGDAVDLAMSTAERLATLAKERMRP
jgi:hypothetical protein